jgi:hypothetical protein
MTFRNGNKFVVDGEAIYNLTRHFGFEAKPIKVQEDGQEVWKYLHNQFFNVLADTTVTGNGENTEDGDDTLKIIQLYARVEAAELLSIKMQFADETTREVTYSGRFTVWWSN